MVGTVPGLYHGGLQEAAKFYPHEASVLDSGRFHWLYDSNDLSRCLVLPGTWLTWWLLKDSGHTAQKHRELNSLWEELDQWGTRGGRWARIQIPSPFHHNRLFQGMVFWTICSEISHMGKWPTSCIPSWSQACLANLHLICSPHFCLCHFLPLPQPPCYPGIATSHKTLAKELMPSTQGSPG